MVKMQINSWNGIQNFSYIKNFKAKKSISKAIINIEESKQVNKIIYSKSILAGYYRPKHNTPHQPAFKKNSESNNKNDFAYLPVVQRIKINMRLKNLDENSLQKFRILTRKNLKFENIDELFDFIEKNDKNSDKFKTVISVLGKYEESLIFRNFNDIFAYSSLSKSESQRIEELLNLQKDKKKEASVTLKIATLKQEKYDNIKDLIKSGIPASIALKAKDFDEFQINALKDYSQKGLNDLHGFEIIQKNADNHEKIAYISSVMEDLIDKEYNSADIFSMSKLKSTEKCKQYVELSDILDKHDRFYQFNFANQSKEKFSKIKFLLNKNLCCMSLQNILKQNPKRLDELIFMINKKNDTATYDDYAILDNKGAEKYFNLFNHNVNRLYIMPILWHLENDKYYSQFTKILETQSIQKLLKKDNENSSLFLRLIAEEMESSTTFNNKEIKNIKILAKYNNFLSVLEHGSTYIGPLLKDFLNQEPAKVENIFSNDDFKYIFEKIKIDHFGTTANINLTNCMWGEKNQFQELCKLDNDTLSRLGKIANSEYIKQENKNGDFQLFNLIILSKIPNFDTNNFDNLKNKTENQHQQMLKYPELYINGENEGDSTEDKINKFFKQGFYYFLLANSIFDKATMDVLLRTRMKNTLDYMLRLTNFSSEELKLLSRLVSSCNIHGKPFSEKQKISFIDLIESYKINRIDTTIIQEMAKNGIVDIGKLNKNIFIGVLKNCGWNDNDIANIPKEKLTEWDMQYMHFLTMAIKEDPAYYDILQAANLDNFDRYIHDKSNKYGMTNAKTKKAFEKNNINYKKWLNPSEKNNVQFISKNKEFEQLKQISNQIKENMQQLLQTHANIFIKKQFPDYVKNNEFIIPSQYETSTAKLTELTQSIINQMKPVFKRAHNNLNLSDKKSVAQNTLTIEDNLNQLLTTLIEESFLDKAKSDKNIPNFDLTIEMWKRKPQTDLFQGHYSDCCISLDGSKSYAMPHYLLNTAFNMIEIKDNTTGTTIGNALCYFIKEKNRKLAFIVDNIEINNSNELPKKVGIELRNAITQYASNVAKEVTGRDDISVYMSEHYNDVPDNDLEKTHQRISFIGNIDCNKIYIDSYDGEINNCDLYDNSLTILKLR